MEERTLLKTAIIAIFLLVISIILNVILFIEYQSPDKCEESSGMKEIVPTEMSYQDYSGAMMEYADLSGANGYKAVFQGTDLRHADLHGGTFSLADFSGADLTGTDLVGTSFDYADLSGAKLVDADMRLADLRGADLTGADLTGALIEGADFRWIKGNYTI